MEFTCNSKQLADYLVKHGSKFIKVENGLFVFVKDETIDENLDKWAADHNKCMF